MTSITPSKTYPSDTPCKRCGNDERYLSDNRCCQCRRDYLKKRSQSPEGKAAYKRYWHSEKGKRAQKEWNGSEKGKTTRTKYKKSEHGRQQRRYAHVNRTYNLSKEKYDNFLQIQNSCCAICKVSLDRPYVDHNHQCCEGEKSCGKCVRGLLCFSCNRLLADANDKTETLQSAINYLYSRNPSS